MPPRRVPSPMFGTDRLIVDVETSGLVEDAWSEPLELGAVVLDRYGRLTGEAFSSLVRPRALDVRASTALGINRLDPCELATAPERDAVRDAFRAWVHERKRPLEWRAWNAPFDGHFLGMLGARPVHLGCSMSWAADVLYRRSGLISLDDAASALGVPWPEGMQRHRALGDARLTALVEAALVVRERRQVQGRKGRREAQRRLTYVRLGRAAFRSGTLREANPYEATSAEAVAWTRGWEQALAWAGHAQVRAAELERARALADLLGAIPFDGTSYLDAHASVTLRRGELGQEHVLQVREGVWRLVRGSEWVQVDAGPFPADAPVDEVALSVVKRVRELLVRISPENQGEHNGA